MSTVCFNLYDLQVYEIIALLVDNFVNKKLYLKDYEDQWSKDVTFEFDEFENIYRVNSSGFEYKIKYEKDDDNPYEIIVRTEKSKHSYYTDFIHRIRISLYSKTQTIQSILLKYNSHAELENVVFDRDEYSYSSDEEKEKINKRFVKVIDNIRKYEEAFPILKEKLVRFTQFRYDIVRDINLISKLHKYKDQISNYMITQPDIDDLRDFIYEYIKPDHKYQFKSLRLKRKGRLCTFSLGSDVCSQVSVDDLNSYKHCLSVIIPVLKADGGIPLFRRLITEKRLRKE